MHCIRLMIDEPADYKQKLLEKSSLIVCGEPSLDVIRLSAGLCENKFQIGS